MWIYSNIYISLSLSFSLFLLSLFSVCLSVYPSICLPVYLSHKILDSLSFPLSAYTSTWLRLPQFQHKQLPDICVASQVQPEELRQTWGVMGFAAANSLRRTGLDVLDLFSPRTKQGKFIFCNQGLWPSPLLRHRILFLEATQRTNGAIHTQVAAVLLPHALRNPQLQTMSQTASGILPR